MESACKARIDFRNSAKTPSSPALILLTSEMFSKGQYPVSHWNWWATINNKPYSRMYLYQIKGLYKIMYYRMKS